MEEKKEPTINRAGAAALGLLAGVLGGYVFGCWLGFGLGEWKGLNENCSPIVERAIKGEEVTLEGAASDFSYSQMYGPRIEFTMRVEERYRALHCETPQDNHGKNWNRGKYFNAMSLMRQETLDDDDQQPIIRGILRGDRVEVKYIKANGEEMFFE